MLELPQISWTQITAEIRGINAATSDTQKQASAVAKDRSVSIQGPGFQEKGDNT